MRIYYEEKGTIGAPTIVFIHGGGLTGEIWNNQIKHFNDYHCIVVDLPEHGRSANIKPFTFKDSAKYIADIIKECATNGKAHVVGHSLGGIILFELLSRNEELIDHAIVASGNLRPTFLYKLFSMTLLCKMMSFFSTRNKENTYATTEMYQRMYKEAASNLRIPDGLDEVKTRTLLIAGEREPKVLKKSNEDLLNILENSKGIYIKRMGHNYPWVKHSLFNRIIRKWINNENIIIENVHII